LFGVYEQVSILVAVLIELAAEDRQKSRNPIVAAIKGNAQEEGQGVPTS
jgi:hypothetical protein